MKRKLASIQRVSDVVKHPNADLLDLVYVKGWQCVAKRGEFIPGDLVVYFEIDSVLPVRSEFEFLRKGCYVKKDWLPNSEGMRLRTIKLRGAVSQGLVVHLGAINVDWRNEHKQEGVDVTDLVGVVKWDPPLPAQLGGVAKGNFPSFIPKTDQERIQNAFDDIMQTKQDGEVFERTVKLDGSSCTVFYHDRELGVCSRNLQLKIEENQTNSFVRAAIDTGLTASLTEYCNKTGRSIAVQAELMGPGVQGNRESLPGLQLFVFDIFDILKQQRLLPGERYNVFKELAILGFKGEHVPVLSTRAAPGYSVEWFLKDAEGHSLNHLVREGVVWKSTSRDLSFKAISNTFLLGEK